MFFDELLGDGVALIPWSGVSVFLLDLFHLFFTNAFCDDGSCSDRQMAFCLVFNNEFWLIGEPSFDVVGILLNVWAGTIENDLVRFELFDDCNCFFSFQPIEVEMSG